MTAAMLLLTIWTAQVSEGPPLPYGVAAHAGGSVRGVPVITGGSSWSADKKTKLRHRETLAFINDKWTPGPPLPTPRSDLAYACDDSGLYVAGGTDGQSESRDVWRLSDVNATWEKLPSLPEPIASAGGAILNSTFYVAGGFVKGKPTDQLWALDTRADAQWQARTALPAPGRAYPALLAHGKFIYLFGGYYDQPAQTFADAWRYDPAADRWEKLEGFNFPGYGWSAVSVGDQRILLAGRIDEHETIRDEIWLIDLNDPKPMVMGKLVIQSCCLVPVAIDAQTCWLIGGEPDVQRTRSPRVSVIRVPANDP